MDSEQQPRFPRIHNFTKGWWILLPTLLTALPWTIVAIFDAINSSYHGRRTTAFRLFTSSFCLLIAYSTSIFFIALLSIEISHDSTVDRHDEVAALVVLLILNVWHIGRNVRGWLQYFAIHKLDPMFRTIQTNFANSFPSAGDNTSCIQGLKHLRISDRLVDNEWKSDAPFLSPFYRLYECRDHANVNPAAQAWAIAMWRAWWTQDTSASEKLSQSDRDTLRTCQSRDVNLIESLVNEKTTRLPSRMCALWYATSAFEFAYSYNRCKAIQWHPENSRRILFPHLNSWLQIAEDIAKYKHSPMSLSSPRLKSYASELASSSIILGVYPEKYRALVEQIHRDGLNAATVHGWCRDLACSESAWTQERIYFAMLNGLSLLVIGREVPVSEIGSDVRSLLYGYAAFEVSDREGGRNIAETWHAELQCRYMNNKDVTSRCRGLHAIRIACGNLGIPAEASHMDGLPSFSAGWCSGYLTGKTGRELIRYGTTHEEIEKKESSSTAWRYPQLNF